MCTISFKFIKGITSPLAVTAAKIFTLIPLLIVAMNLQHELKREELSFSLLIQAMSVE